MKSFMKSLKRQDGFTLVELMVVVAIIGVLSAVAIPNFKKYQAKAKTSEAKLQLSAAYTAEQSFYSDYNMYHVCLGYMGYNPTNEAAQRLFAIGFNTTGIAAAGAPITQAIASGLSVAACPNTGANAGTSFFAASKLLSGAVGTLANFQANSAGGAVATNATTGTQAVGAETFNIGAVGPVDSSNIATGANYAGFTINENKVLSHVVVGY
jgi:type IV pilus assembly protein PilA